MHRKPGQNKPWFVSYCKHSGYGNSGTALAIAVLYMELLSTDADARWKNFAESGLAAGGGRLDDVYEWKRTHRESSCGGQEYRTTPADRGEEYASGKGGGNGWPDGAAQPAGQRGFGSRPAERRIPSSHFLLGPAG